MPYSAKVMQGEWREEWKDMPEFEQEDLSPKRTILLHFRNEEDVQKFAKLVKQKITPKQRAIWFPEKIDQCYTDKRYIDES